MSFGLSDSTITAIISILKKNKHIEKAIIYGSRANKTYKPGSDIDITFKGKKLTLSDLYSISADLDTLMLPYTFDLSIWNTIDNPNLLTHIQEVGIVFFQNTTQK